MTGGVVTRATPAPVWTPGWDPEALERLANMGGPMSRTRTERIAVSILGHDTGAVRCPRVLRIAIDFGRRSPLTCVRDLLKQCGCADEQEARAAVALPVEACICRPDPMPTPVPFATLAPEEGLFQVLVLGLCTPWLYDPARPVLWTRTSLTRRLELFDGRGFYA
ncbi:MAG: hypothetical protein O3A25_20200 [Acidobacteria bacterium]|nr:hypothetical protein [Acidobacteriota bacterium]